MGGGSERVGRDLGHAQEVTRTRFNVDRFVRVDFKSSEIIRQLDPKRVFHAVQIYLRLIHFSIVTPHIYLATLFQQNHFLRYYCTWSLISILNP